MNMMRLIKHGLITMADVYVEPRPYQYRTSGGFAADHARLAGDVRQVGRDITITIEKHGKQPYQFSGKKR